MDTGSAFASINWIAVAIAVIAPFMLGALWYGPLFGKAWMEEMGFTEESIKAGNPAKIYGFALLLNVVMVVNLAMFLGPEANLMFGMMAGLFTGLGFVAAMTGVQYLFEMRPMRLFLINGGYSTVAFTVMGTILGAMN